MTSSVTQPDAISARTGSTKDLHAMGIFDKITKAIEKYAQSRPQFDPSIFNDEIALKTAWGPAKSGGTSFGTHSLVEVSPKRAEFKARGMALLFPGLFMAVGLISGIAMTLGGLAQDEMVLLYVGIPFGCIFFFAGFFVLRSFNTPRVFDLSTGQYWKGRRAHMNMDNLKEHCRISDIHAVQLIRESVSSSNGGRYSSYELNLVLKDGNRLNVVDHGKHSLIRADTEKLGQFLGVPVWDATLE